LKSKIELPKGWILAKLRDLVIDPVIDFVDGPFGSNLKSSEYKTEGIPVFKIQNIKAGYFLDKNIQFVSPEKAEQLKRHSFRLGDIIITKLGEPLGLCCDVPDKYPYGIIVADLIRIRPSKLIINTDYLVYAINSKFIQDQFKENTKGTTRARVNLSIVRDINIPVAPLDEQLRIVAKINDLLADLNNGKTKLEKSLSQLSIYREVFLRLAFEGKLTEKWRSQQKKLPEKDELLNSIQKEREKRLSNNNQKIKPIRKQNKEEIDRLPKIPNTWIWCRNEELLDYTTSGSRDWKKYYSTTGDLFIRTQDIKTNTLAFENIARVKLPKKVEGMRSLVEMNDLLMTITGANVGKVALIKKKIPVAYVSQSVALMKYIDKRISPYMNYYFQAKKFGQTFIENMVYGVGRPVLSLQNMKDVPVCLCSVPEQKEIVKVIESRFSKCDKLEKTLIDKIKQSEILRESIMQSAFEGKLVEQNSENEGADKLQVKMSKERELYTQQQKQKKKGVTRNLKFINMAEHLKTILQLLEESKKPLSAYSVWKLSEHSQDIDAFYTQLKKHVDNGEVIETRLGKDSYLSMHKIS